MITIRNLFLAALISIISFSDIFGQIIQNGTFSGSFESNNNFYQTDSAINAIAPDDKLGSNTYFKFDYKIGKFTAGIQYEAYLPPQVGYSQLLEGNKLTGRYASYNDSLFTFTVGTFYEQFGNGLILRSYEERALGINNSLDGFSLKLNPHKSATIKAIWGKQRKYLDNGESTIRGIDGEIDILSLFNNESNYLLSIGGSFVNRYQPYTGPDENIPTSVNAFASRLKFEYKAYSVNAEYVNKQKEPQQIHSGQITYNEGSAFLLQQTITAKGFGSTLSLRRIENIDFRSERENDYSKINYIPALTKQHKYTLANFHPYSSQLIDEIGGQLDVFYSVPRNTSITWAKGLKVNVNISRYWKTDYNNSNYFSIGDTLFYNDISLEIEKKFSSGFKTNVSFINQEYNKGAITGGSGVIKANIAVIESSIRLKNNVWLKVELSELFPIQNENKWTYIMSELSVAPKWTLFVSDIIEHSTKNTHYYNLGFSYTRNASRIAINWGRNKEGYSCAGGICKPVPSYSGLGVSVSTTF